MLRKAKHANWMSMWGRALGGGIAAGITGVPPSPSQIQVVQPAGGDPGAQSLQQLRAGLKEAWSQRIR